MNVSRDFGYNMVILVGDFRPVCTGMIYLVLCFHPTSQGIGVSRSHTVSSGRVSSVIPVGHWQVHWSTVQRMILLTRLVFPYCEPDKTCDEGERGTLLTFLVAVFGSFSFVWTPLRNHTGIAYSVSPQISCSVQPSHVPHSRESGKRPCAHWTAHGQCN